MQHSIGSIKINDFDYPLPAELIAQYPLQARDSSRLLVYKQGRISEDTFANLATHLPADSLLVFNETRVVHARLLFQKETGAVIEIFCLEPYGETCDVQLAYQQTGHCKWKCLVGNAKRWKSSSLQLETTPTGETVKLEATLISRETDGFVVRFNWRPQSYSFAHILEVFGKVPLPPYISRQAEMEDNTRYQTVFARTDGSVAAPTAGLHFTQHVFEHLKAKQIETAGVTLHVGAGTFKPVSTPTIGEHYMHNEQVVVSAALLRKILAYQNKSIILVGTTTVRTLESVYWQGVKWLLSPPVSPYMRVEQWDPYRLQPDKPVSLQRSLECVLQALEKFGFTELHGETSLMIAPGYNYHIPHAIVTNFHQPKSTLLLLVSAFVGAGWKEAYNYAISNKFRFLSYGDSCLFFKHPY